MSAGANLGEGLLRAIDAGRMIRPRRYQSERIKSTSRFNLDLWSRQTGKSITSAIDAVFLAATTHEDVMCLSASRDLTSELMVKVAEVAEVVYGVAGEIVAACRRGELDQPLPADWFENRLHTTQTVITLPGGERIIGRPANPRTARGFTAHVKLDEFGMHQNPDEIYAAAYPSITARPGLRLDVMSTPGLRTDDKFADLCRAAERGDSDFAFRKVTIHDAVRDGLAVDPEELRRNLRDEDRWRREFLCEFVDEGGAFLTYELIRAAQHEALTKGLPADAGSWDEAGLGWNPDASGGGELFAGVDVGRHHDLTVLWLGQLLGDVLWTRAVVEMRRVPFSEQYARIERIIDKLGVRRCCIDATGLGMQLAEQLGQRFGAYRVEPVTFTARVKAALAEPWRRRFEDKGVRLPIDLELMEDLHSIRKVATAAGNVRYAGERTPDGHADRFWAGALCNHAAEDQGAVPCATVFDLGDAQ